MERITVLAGTFNLGMGDSFDAHETKPMPAGTCRRGRRSGFAAIAISAISGRWPTTTAASRSRSATSTRP